MEGARHGVSSEPGGGGGVLVDSETSKGAEAYVGGLGVSAAYQVAQTTGLLLIVRSAGGTHMNQITQETFRVLQVVLKIVLKDTPEKGEKCAHMHTIKQNKKFPLLVHHACF